MICFNCKEKIPLISNLDLEEGLIVLFCQCDKENKEYNIKDYLIELNEIKKEKNIKIKNQCCFIHKNNEIELFCVNCSKELCFDCDIKIHQKDNHQLCQLNSFYDMIEKNIIYYHNINDFIYNKKINQKYINEIIKLLECIYHSFYEQKNANEINFTALKNVCYLEMRLFEYDNNNKYVEINKNEDNYKKPLNKIKYDEKINNIRHYAEIKMVELNNRKKNKSISFFNILLIPNSYYCILISENKIIMIDVNNNEKEIEKKIKAEYELNPKIYSSIYNLSLLNENIFSLIYTSGSFDLFFIQKDDFVKNAKIKLVKKKYICADNTTNIISQIKLSKEKNKLIVLMNNKIKFFEYNNNSENINIINEIDRNHLTLFIDLNFHNSLLSLFNNKEIIIKDQLTHKTHIIDIKEKNINLIYEIKSMNYLAITHFDNNIDLFDMNLMIMKEKLIGHKNIINDIKELIPLNNSSYKTKLISCSDDNTIRIWNLIKFTCDLIILIENGGLLYKLNILPNKEIMALSNENYIYIIE